MQLRPKPGESTIGPHLLGDVRGRISSIITQKKIPKREPQSAVLWAYTLLTVGVGSFIYFFAAYNLPPAALDLRLALIVFLTLFVSSRIIIQIPRFSSQISVSDTLIFLTLLLYGGPAAIVLAGTEALLSSVRFSKKPSTILFNWSCATCSAFVTSLTLYFYVGDVVALKSSPLSARIVAAIALMACVQYVANSGLVAICGALKAGSPIWQTWKTHYLWTSITYFAGAYAAAIIARLTNEVGIYAILATLPIIGVIFLTYRTYLQNIESAAKQADQAENHIRELSHYINEQERIREQFSQIEKLSALGELASGVAHDFNNTLAGILGRAQLLLRTNDPQKIERGLKIIIKTAEDGARTVKRIQDFARQRRDHDFDLISVGQILLDVSEITRPRWKDQAEACNVHIHLNVEIRSNRKIMGDESELREVLVNMVFNAVDAMPKGGTLTLRAEDSEDFVLISVSDTGTGMSAEVRSRIFDPFFTTKGKAGMGLGLAVSFGIVRRHEGTIEVDSQVGSGTTFTIRLPAADSVSEPADQLITDADSAGQIHAAPERRRHTDDQPNILVVDDESCVRDLLKDILESEGCRVYLAGGGREALALFDAREFDAVFTDVGMPGMSGWELAQAIRQRSEIPIAVITGWGEAVGSEDQKNAGVDWVVTKPFDADRIAQLAGEVIRNRQAAKSRSSFSFVTSP
jgi:signal transduction histidine kinase/ActR/RegA family two-component response regulator